MFHVTARAWLIAYLILVTLPLWLMMIRPTPPARPFLVEASLALGFVGLIQMALQFALIARFRGLTAPLGIDTILRHHRRIAAVALLFLIAHPVMLAIHEPSLWAAFDPFGGSWANRTGAWALYGLILLALLSVGRKTLRLSYEAWRVSHAVLGIATIVLAHVHLNLAGRYSDVLWKELVLIAITLLAVSGFVWLRLIRPALAKRRPYRVARMQKEAGDVWTVDLEPDGHAGMRFDAGQFAYLTLGPNPYTLDEHPFSFASSAERAQRDGSVGFAIKELGDFTRRLGNVPIGTVAHLDGPHGSFTPDRFPAPGYVLISGGIGLAPLLSMIRTLRDRGDPRPVLLIHGEKRLEDVPYLGELRALEREMPLDLVLSLEEPPEGWDGERGFIDEAMLRRLWPDERFRRTVFVCGPNPMISAVESALRRIGVPDEDVHAERFDLV